MPRLEYNTIESSLPDPFDVSQWTAVPLTASTLNRTSCEIRIPFLVQFDVFGLVIQTGRTKAIWGETGRAAQLSHVPHNGTVVSSDPLWTARAQSPKLHGQALAALQQQPAQNGGHSGSKWTFLGAQHLMSLIRKQTVKLLSSRLAHSKLSQGALMLYISPVQKGMWCSGCIAQPLLPAPSSSSKAFIPQRNFPV